MQVGTDVMRPMWMQVCGGNAGQLGQVAVHYRGDWNAGATVNVASSVCWISPHTLACFGA